jgi:hypothetical protein
MDFEIMPLTPAGHRFVALAEDHAHDFATRAERHDREASFPVENIEALRRSGASGATVHAVAEIEIGLAMSRSMIARTGVTLDTFFQTHGLGALPMGGLHDVMKDFQCTK